MSETFKRIEGLDFSSDTIRGLQDKREGLLPQVKALNEQLADINAGIYKERVNMLKSEIERRANEAGGIYYKISGDTFTPDELFYDIDQLHNRYNTRTIFIDNEVHIVQPGTEIRRVYVFGKPAVASEEG